MTDRIDLLAHFPPGFTPRPEQARLLGTLADAIAEAFDDPAAPRVFLVEAPPGVGKSHVAMALARWSGDAYLLTSQKLLQDQYEREFGSDLQLVKGRDNYVCERYPDARVPTSRGMCRRPRGPVCQCPYARAKNAALNGPIFCTNTAYFATLRHWRAEQLRKRRLLIIDEAHNLESQLVSVFTVAFPPDDAKAWFGGPLPRLDSADQYRSLLCDHLERMEAQLETVTRALEIMRPSDVPTETFLSMPPSRAEQELMAERESLEAALAPDDGLEVPEDPEALERQARLVLVGVVHAHQRARLAGGAGGQVTTLQQTDVPRAHVREVKRGAGAVGAAADDDDVRRGGHGEGFWHGCRARDASKEGVTEQGVDASEVMLPKLSPRARALGVSDSPEGLQGVMDLLGQRGGVDGAELTLEGLALGSRQDVGGQHPLIGGLGHIIAFPHRAADAARADELAQRAEEIQLQAKQHVELPQEGQGGPRAVAVTSSTGHDALLSSGVSG